tara:strand:- start:196 stop:579 length:384 start_codon:yes stop_codon:yes gene_type:complete
MIKLKNLIKEDISISQLNQVEKHLDKIWAKVGIDVEFTRHFHDRVNDERNKKPISTAEIIRIYREIYKKYGKPISKLSNGVEILLKDMSTDINVPVVLKWDGKEFDMIAKTVMRKKNFKSRTKKYAV